MATSLELVKVCFAVTSVLLYITLCVFWFSSSRCRGLGQLEKNRIMLDVNQEKQFDSVEGSDALWKVKKITGCMDKPMVKKFERRGDYWVLYNYVKANKNFKCHESITYTTHGDYTFIDNLVPLLERWRGPVSIALHAPGTDFKNTIESIAYLRECSSSLIKEYVSFHIYFGAEHVPEKVSEYYKLSTGPYNCSQPAPFMNSTTEQMYKTQKGLVYPINVGRNVAREMAQTHFVFASDIELYPSPNTITQFLLMIAENKPPLVNSKPRVYPLNIFEISEDEQVPHNKTILKKMLVNGTAINFHKNLCTSCHKNPKDKEWIAADETEGLHVFHVAKSIPSANFVYWEPIFIGTHSEPLYDERLSWEGKRDKMTQAYSLCVFDYEFMILDNAFLVHKPGIKVHKSDPKRKAVVDKQNEFITKVILPEMQAIYGIREGCVV